MPIFLRERATNLAELMDDPACDKARLFETYRQFSTVNRLFSGWGGLYRERIRPRLSQAMRPLRLLDIGCGGADMLQLLVTLAEADGFALQAVGIEPEPRALEYLKQVQLPASIVVRQATSRELAEAGEQFDLVISNHLLHHLTAGELSELLIDAERLCTGLVIFNDLRRSDLAYGFFSIFANLVFHGSFIAADGMTSLRRSYTPDELRNVAPAGWQVATLHPNRLILSRECDCHA